MNVSRRLRFAVAAVALACAAVAAACDGARAAEDYPRRPVRIFVPYGAGGAGDMTIRLLANKVSQNLKQAFVIENRPGAGGIAAMRAVLGASRGRLHARRNGERPGDQHEPVPEPALRRAQRLCADLRRGELRDPVGGAADLALQNGEGCDRGGAQVAGQAQPRRDQSRAARRICRQSCSSRSAARSSRSSPTEPRPIS